MSASTATIIAHVATHSICSVRIATIATETDQLLIRPGFEFIEFPKFDETKSDMRTWAPRKKHMRVRNMSDE